MRWTGLFPTFSARRPRKPHSRQGRTKLEDEFSVNIGCFQGLWEKKQRVNPFKHVEVAHCFTSPPMLVWSEHFSYHSKHWSPITGHTKFWQKHLVCSSRESSATDFRSILATVTLVTRCSWKSLKIPQMNLLDEKGQKSRFQKGTGTYQWHHGDECSQQWSLKISEAKPPLQLQWWKMRLTAGALGFLLCVRRVAWCCDMPWQEPEGHSHCL